MRKLTVGQVLFVLVPGETNIHPVRVVEEVHRRTLQGEEVNYMIELPVKGKRTVVPLDPDITVFSSIVEARDHLLDNARRAIEKICDVAHRVSEKEFPDQSPPVHRQVTKENVRKVAQEPVQESTSVLLENGVVANIKLPPELSE